VSEDRPPRNPVLLAHEETAANLSAWVSQQVELVRGMAVLRQLRGEGCVAEARRTAREIMRVRASWELWTVLADADDIDPDVLLAVLLPTELIELARFALWGSRSVTQRGLRIVDG
jgi:hypothetical protein